MTVPAELADLPMDWRHKGWPAVDGPLRSGEVPEMGWNIFDGSFLMPVMLLKMAALEHNARLMAGYCREHGVLLAPHGKTSMAPQLFQTQMDLGAWGITVSTISQARVCRHFKVPRVLLANQLVDAAGLHWLSRELARDPSFQFLCLVDSVAGVRLMDEELGRVPPPQPVRVLVELGQMGGRSGCRTIAEAVAVAELVRSSSHLQLAGVEGFEGLISAPTVAETCERVRSYLAQLRELTLTLASNGAFEASDEVVISAGGSAYFDLVVENLTGWPLEVPVRTILRSGCYLAHDVQMYEDTSPLAARGNRGHDDRLWPAFELWAVVTSRPEPQLAILNFGKRDAAYDYGMPRALWHVPRGGRRPTELDGGSRIAQLNDQHAYLELGDGVSVAVGDLVGCGISHPCAAFDKWTMIPAVDEGYGVVDVIRTFF